MPFSWGHSTHLSVEIHWSGRRHDQNGNVRNKITSSRMRNKNRHDWCCGQLMCRLGLSSELCRWPGCGWCIAAVHAWCSSLLIRWVPSFCFSLCQVLAFPQRSDWNVDWNFIYCWEVIKASNLFVWIYTHCMKIHLGLFLNKQSCWSFFYLDVSCNQISFVNSAFLVETVDSDPRVYLSIPLM